MKVRSSETNTNHPFAKQLFQALHIGEVQGLLINSEGNFSCCVEYIEYEQQGEHFSKQFTREEWWQKKWFARAVGVPFYVVVGNLDGTYSIYEVFVDENNVLKYKFFLKNLGADKMVQQWEVWKGTRQVKKLTEAALRVRQTRIDAILEAAGLQWGGNIDGFINSGSVVHALIE
ncbi:MAG: hypothetical protein M3Z24_07805, partial [Chloroflexota bacterium]|nr:hypothetical protein [Chloroflexota bacterium]